MYNASSKSGPLPDADELVQYEQALPGLATTIVGWADTNQAEFHEARKAAEAAVDTHQRNAHEQAMAAIAVEDRDRTAKASNDERRVANDRLEIVLRHAVIIGGVAASVGLGIASPAEDAAVNLALTILPAVVGVVHEALKMANTALERAQPKS